MCVCARDRESGRGTDRREFKRMCVEVRKTRETVVENAGAASIREKEREREREREREMKKCYSRAGVVDRFWMVSS